MILLALGVAAPATAAPACTKASIEALAPPGTVIDDATPTASPVPHCLINGHVITTDPGPNQVNFRLQLPDSGFNGRYYMIGLGGAAGHVPTNSQIPAGNPVTKGWAVAGTDTGHTGAGADWSFVATDEAKRVDHHHRGVHVTALATQQITRRYYGRDKIYRYISGCSGGGRMGHMSALFHPEDFDGHLIGAPGNGHRTILMFMWSTQQMGREPGAWTPPAKLEMLDRKVTAACDAADGAVDQVVWDPKQCRFDFAALQCKDGTDGDECLTPPQLRTVQAILAGPSGPEGNLAAGMPITNIGTGWKAFVGTTPPPWSETRTPGAPPPPSGFLMGNNLARTWIGPDFNYMSEFDFKDQKDIDAWLAGVKRTGWGAPSSGDWRPLERSGNKVLWWHGVSDAGPTLATTDEIYADVHAVFGGDEARVARFAPLYLVPGMLHCGGGTGPNDAPDRLLETLIDWVEHGKAPGPVVTRRGPFTPVFNPVAGPQESGVRIPSAEGAEREFLLCPAPMRSRFNGQPGGEMWAKNWACVKD